MGADARAMRLSAGGQDLYALILERIDGRPMRLARYWGQVLLVVNVASRSPLANQLCELQALHECYGEAGLKVLAFPCNDFGGMEPGDNAQVQYHYERDLGFNFPLFSKVSIASASCPPLFAMLTTADGAHSGPHDVPSHALSALPQQAMNSDAGVQDNFEKFVVSRDGRLLHRFACGDRPQAPHVLAALEHALERPREDL
jgi:glutathione peroxidase